MSLAAQNLRVLKANQLSTDKFAELCTYHPEGGAARSVVCLVQPDTRREESEQTEDLIEQVTVLCLRDPDDADKGGIAAVRMGEKFYRDPSRDTSTRPFTFTAEVREQGIGHQVLIANRDLRVVQGRKL